MNKTEFEKLAKKQLVIGYLKNEWKIEEDDEVLKTYEEIENKLRKLFMNETRTIVCDGVSTDYSDFCNDKEYYIKKYIDRKLQIMVPITLNELDNWKEEEWN